MLLLDAKYDGAGGVWLSKSGSPKVAGQGSIQIGGRKLSITIFHNENQGGPDYNIRVNDRNTASDDMVWMKALHPANATNGAAPTMTGTTFKPPTLEGQVVVCRPAHPDWPDDDIPF